MRYPQGGGLTAERQAFRERVRMEAVAMFAGGRASTEIAKELRVSVRSVQRWTLARIKTLIGRRFHKSMTLSGISQMLRRRGWSHQVPARRAVERDEAAVAGWVKEVWPHLEPPRRHSGPGSSSKTRRDSR
ncbi:winged helix-turn-helix domain-containing protein [Streptomyces goshikiensis]|uniref:winged helix-turn-helix domain-containing protein n=1 Tax=Streptomyces goshikiensis TaxID=1942 RepID=UPI003699B758